MSAGRLRMLVGPVTALAVLAWVALLTQRKEQLRSSGKLVFFELAPRDPRSLLQGDYMVLNYRITANLPEAPPVQHGWLIFSTDPRGVAHAGRIVSDDRPPEAGSHRIPIQKRDDRFHFGAESFFFREGRAQHFSRARYAGIRVSRKGDHLLTGLYDAELKEIQ